MVDGMTMTIILALWMTLTWAVTYMVVNHRREKEIKKLVSELSEYMLLVDEMMYGSGLHDGYAEYEVQEDGSWIRVD